MGAARTHATMKLEVSSARRRPINVAATWYAESGSSMRGSRSVPRIVAREHDEQNRHQHGSFGWRFMRGLRRLADVHKETDPRGQFLPSIC